MQDPATPQDDTTNSHCSECGIDKALVFRQKLTRGRCRNCYRRHVYALKKAGQFASLNGARPIAERLRDGVTPGPNDCLLWKGSPNPANGYCYIVLPGDESRLVHRVAYSTFVGPIADGMQIDHICHNRDTTCPGGRSCLHRRCINPDHLEAVTSKENTLRSPNAVASRNAKKTHCDNGHEFTPENTELSDTGKRACRTCRRDRFREYRIMRRMTDPNWGRRR